ncbi:type I-E CRISPR-associated protein Cse1/CasA [candidate division WOR-3 bacterium]|nr:type I-E CRISPR-associated protein Cse1/CasA [candidate division WOR-3 bacterium]
MDNKFNLVDEKWIPIANYGLVSLADVFSQSHFIALGGNPIQKIALTKLLLAIAQAAYTPEDDEDWIHIGTQGMAEKALSYLKKKKDCFWLYGVKPFLQMPSIVKATKQSYGAVSASVATGNTTVLVQSQIEQNLTDAEKAILIVELCNFALGGKKTDNSIVLSPGYTEKSNEKGKSSAGKPGPALGFMGFLHNFLIGESILESLWFNLIPKNQIISAPHLTKGIGIAPWEGMPQGEDCEKAKELKTTYLGRLVPLCRFVLLANDGLHYSEGIFYPGYAQGGFDLSTGVDFSTAKARVLWVDTEKRPWRQLTSLLAFLANEKKGSFDCYQLRFGLSRVRNTQCKLGIWSGGLCVSSNAGEQYASGTDDFVESEFFLETAWLGESWFLQLKSEMAIIESLAKNVYGSTMGFYKHQFAEGKDQATQAANLFWQLAEQHFQELINACGSDTAESLRPKYAQIALKAYDTYCPKNTARQLDAWAANRPQLGKYFSKVTS